MPKSPRYTLIWSEIQQYYELQIHKETVRRLPPGEVRAFSDWLETQTSFAFIGQAGRLSVLKEARARGAGYWYAYRKQNGHTRKGYLGPSSQVTFARLEEQARSLASLPSSPPLARDPIRPGFQISIPLLSTKLVPPHLPGFLVERPRLLHDLDAARAHPLTLVSASAGSGKTTLLSVWASRQGQPVAWLSLDALDADPIRFWAACLSALRSCWPMLGEEAFALLHAPQSPPLSTILVALLNEIMLLGQEIILILDDYHVISDQAINEGMLFVLDHLPDNLHLILSSRTDPELPLSRLRVRSQILEIRSRELCFTREEAADFLVHRMHLSLSEEDMAILGSRTEGWIAGLQLAALSLSRQPNPSRVVADFRGSHRYLLDYVQQDILAQLSGPLQDFLLQTSVVTRMNAALCQAVTAQPSLLSSQQMLEEVERANLFVMPLDEHRHWYRHHDLFREALLARLHASQPELIPLLHQRAARWYETQGELHEAITHALAAPDFSYAASLMEQAAPTFWLRGEIRPIHNWVLSLPDVVLRAHMRLALSATLRVIDSVNLSNVTLHAAMAAQVEHTFTRMEELLREKQRWAFSEAEATLIGRRLSLLRAWIELRAILKHGDIDRLRHVATSLESFPLDEEVSWNMISLSFAFWLASPHLGAGAALAPRLREAVHMTMEAKDYQMAIRVKAMLAVVLTLDTQFQQAQQQCLEGIALLEQIAGRAPWEGHLYYSLFSVAYARNQLEEASNWLRRMLQIAQDWQQVELLVRGQIYAVRLALAKGDLSLAGQALQELEALVKQEGFAYHVPWVSTLRVQIWLAEGNLAEASAWMAQTTFSPTTWNPLRRWEVLMLMRVLLAQQQNVLAVEALERFRPYFDRSGDLQGECEWLAISVVALHRHGKREQALQVATRLLTITEPEGYVRLDLDTGTPLMREVLTIWLEAHPDEISQAGTTTPARSAVSRLLATLEQGTSMTLRTGTEDVFRQTNQPHPAHLAEKDIRLEPLSPQERRVLRLLVVGQTYAEMAETLVVSPNTVKTQVGSIYRKLGVSRRAEAIAVAARLQLP